MTKQIVAATANKHKIAEMQAILAPLRLRVVSADELGGMPEVIEDGESFRDNAIKKALAGARALGQTVLADDSGLEVFALHGAPGVHSSRYAGEGGNDGRNLSKLLQEMTGIAKRGARFVAVIAVAGPEGLLGTAEGEVRGIIANAPRGQGGFGYDPLFIPEGEVETFAELPATVKNAMSHRGRALQAAVAAGLFA
jgi:XTP/dITP diphosphohydrolase